jgi:hypothetical protein
MSIGSPYSRSSWTALDDAHLLVGLGDDQAAGDLRRGRARSPPANATTDRSTPRKRNGWRVGPRPFLAVAHERIVSDLGVDAAGVGA